MRYTVKVERIIVIDDAKDEEDAVEQAREDVESDVEAWGIKEAMAEFEFEASES